MADKASKLDQLKSILAELADLGSAQSVMSWDQQTYMPKGAVEARGQALGTIGRLVHEKFTDDKVGKLLDDLEKEAKDWDPNSDEARLVKVTRREYDQSVKVPAAMIVEQAELRAGGNAAWQEARAKSEWPIFEPWMEKILDFNLRFVDLFKPYDHPYDVLLDIYEPNMKATDVKQIFDDLRPKQVELIQAISEQPEIDDSVLHRHFPEADQWQFGKEVITAFGYDWDRGSMDKTTHPFAATISYGDNRITVRVDENFFNPFFFGALHESGHSMYEQGISKSLARTPLYGGTSLAVHESQSRMWENLVGRSLPFWEHFFPKLQKTFPEALEGVSLEEWHRAVNKVAPSYIRVEADEATYNLHIMLRLELEMAMIENKIKIKDLPNEWNARFEEYLGIVPANDAQGVLQDVHWSFGLYGYFSTYALGNLISAQFWEVIEKDNPKIWEQVGKGEFKPLLTWLNEKVHASGSKFEPQELVQMVTGSKIDAAPYVRYLTDKFSGIYKL